MKTEEPTENITDLIALGIPVTWITIWRVPLFSLLCQCYGAVLHTQWHGLHTCRGARRLNPSPSAHEIMKCLLHHRSHLFFKVTVAFNTYMFYLEGNFQQFNYVAPIKTVNHSDDFDQCK